ncbi:AfsR/SARP family transcriptional regulator [Streptomyces rubellomurinus]|uniref:SARP family transcriptional regulator n=1 Tax=Streptomyces rubellomurinus (strain ATCC 31215) TaxID=359131 RepID=A0A0F2THN6_STRR3|nr:BTAD domain-containing putative transcriptional regulator [Streptomyces rubellomurinus]KJS62006.1 SARP family transcriptional regulator [Streptomyces rubellomurinus]
MTQVTFGVLGALTADRDGTALALKGPRHRAVLARLIVARRRVVPVTRLIDDLWPDPPPAALGALRTFVADLRRTLEPERPPRAPARLLVTEGPGYALRPAPHAVDAWRFEAAVGAAAELPADRALARLDDALALWRGPAHADHADQDWARAERTRLTELRLRAVEQRAAALLALGRGAQAVPDLRAHLADHPWREDAWRLLALAQYRTGRQGEALAALREARTVLADGLGLDPSHALRRLEADILAQDPGLDLAPMAAATTPGGTTPAATTPAGLWHEAVTAYDRTLAVGARARLESTVGLMRGLAVSGGSGLRAAREHRMAVIAAAERHGDPELTARVIGAFDVPAIWTRSDDPELAARVVAAAERTLDALPAGDTVARCRLLATVALESRGTRDPGAPRAAREAEAIARRLRDPALLAFALNGRFMQSCTRAGLAGERDAIGAELVELAARHGLTTHEVLGHLIRLQFACALGDFAAAEQCVRAVEELSDRHELPLVKVFTDWYRALRIAALGPAVEAETAYRAAAVGLDGAGMPGLEAGLLPLALLALRIAGGDRRPAVDLRQDWGPYRPWAEPFALLATGDRGAARAVLRALPQPPADLLYEACCCLEGVLALELGDREAVAWARDRLLPAAGELVGAGSGLLTLGPVDRHLQALDAALREA